MLKQLLRDSAVYGVTRFLVQGISFFLVPVYTRVLTPEEFGVFDLLTVVGSIAVVLVGLEVTQGVARLLPESRSEAEKAAFASTSLWFCVCAYGLFCLVALAFAGPLTGALFGSAEHRGEFQLAALATCANGLFLLVSNQLRWDLKATRNGVANLANASVALGLSVVLVVRFHLGVAGFFWGQLGGSAVGFVLALVFSSGRYRWAFDAARLRELLAFSLPLVPASLGVFVTLYVDRVAINMLMSLSDVGIFGVAYRLAAVVGLIVGSFQRALTPLIYTHYRDSETPKQLARAFRYFVGAALLGWLTLALFSGELVALFAAQEYAAAASVLPLLTGALILSNMYIFAPGLDLAKRTKAVSVIILGGAVLNTALNFLLIPLWGLQGAALATCSSAAAVFAAYMIPSQRLYFVAHDWKNLGLAAAGTFAAFLLGELLGGGSTSLGWLLRALLLLGTTVALARLALLPHREVLRALRRGEPPPGPPTAAPGRPSPEGGESTPSRVASFPSRD